MERPTVRALVTGSTGFVGGALARRLRALGHEVMALGRNAHRGAALQAEGIGFVHADLQDALAIKNACQGQEVVFHCGAKSALWGRARDFYQANVAGTRNVVAGCLGHGVRRLVHVSSPSIYSDRRDRVDVKESDPLPDKPINAYAASKRQAEAVVDQACKAGLAVVTLRPRAVFGPGDTSLLPRLVARLQGGKLPRIGAGDNRADLTYIDNLVEALLLASASPASTVGRKYNITDGQPVTVWAMIDQLCRLLGYPAPRRQVSYRRAFRLAGALEFAYALARSAEEPPLTRFAVTALAKTQTLNIEAARRELGYTPVVTTEEGLKRWARWWKAQGT